MMKHTLRILFLAACLFGAQWCHAVSGRLYTSNRLSSGLITCICQDRYGFIWVGTEYGLNKFDGYHNYTYTHNRADSTTIIDNEISMLFVDRDGQLWVGCSKGLVRYDYEHDRFQRFYFPDNRQPRISAMMQDTSGRLLIGTAGYGLYSYTEAAGYIHYEDRFCQRHIDDFYSRMHLDREGNLWRSSHRPVLTKFLVKKGQPASLRDYPIGDHHPRCYLEYGPQQLLIICMHGILSYHYQTGEVSDAGFDLSQLPSGVSIENAILSRQGDLYLATSGGLMVIAHGSQKLTRVEDTGGSIDLNAANVVDVMEDKDQNLWAACYNKGLLFFSHQQAAFHSWSLSSQHYLTGGGISSITSDVGNETWCTVQNSGVFRLDANGHVTAHPQSPAGTRLIFRDHRGQYWLTTENVLYRYEPMSGQATPELTLNGRGLNCLCDDATGRLYISSFGMGLYVYDPMTRQGELLSMQQTDRKGGYLCNDWIKSLSFDSRGLLWLCTTNGLSVMNPQGYVFNSRGWNMLLEGQQCFATCETVNGDMLVGTESGLYRYDWQQNKVAEVSGTEALRDKMICAMVRDRQGTVWIATTAGIWEYKEGKQGDTRLIGHIAGNGLTTKEYMLGAVLHHADDHISFGTADGMVTFLPDHVNTSRQQLGKTRLTRFTAGGQSLNPLQNRFELSHDDNSFTLEFSMLDYVNAENIAYQYRLKDSGPWLQTPEGNNQLTFIQLPPGNYHLEVRATAGGIISDHVTQLDIRILKPWYNTWWAWLFYLSMAASFAGLMLFSWRRYQEEKRLNLTISNLKDNMRWLRGKFFGSLEQKGDIKPVRVKGNNDALMERVVKCVNENLSNPDFDMETLTREVGISRAQLHRKMKEMTGIPTSEFVRNLRLEQAARLIRERKINITQVAYSVGFNNQAHFSTVFKKHFGMTPTEYAEKGQ